MLYPKRSAAKNSPASSVSGERGLSATPPLTAGVRSKWRVDWDTSAVRQRLGILDVGC